VDGAISARTPGGFPYGTLGVNLSGSVLLGLVGGLALGGEGETLLGAAALGGYTTFSTWMLETQRGVEEGDTVAPVLNIVLSLVLGVLAAALGRAIA
jgi:CrcB protein